MIPEYYMYEAERVDNGENIQGYVFCKLMGYSKKPRMAHYIIPLTNGKFASGFELEYYKVKPETVRRVAVKPIRDYGWICPNCKSHYVGDKTNYCQECGMALDWSDLSE